MPPAAPMAFLRARGRWPEKQGTGAYSRLYVQTSWADSTRPTSGPLPAAPSPVLHLGNSLPYSLGILDIKRPPGGSLLGPAFPWGSPLTLVKSNPWSPPGFSVLGCPEQAVLPAGHQEEWSGTDWLLGKAWWLPGSG